MNNNANIVSDDLGPKKIILPDINTIISGKVLEEGAGNELLFMSYLISTKFAKKIFKDSAMKTLKEEV